MGIKSHNKREEFKMTDLNEELCKAAEKGNVGDAQKLISQGANVNAITFGNTPLHYAAKNGKTDAVKFLVKHGAKMDERNVDGMTPLHLAAQHNQKEAAVTLIHMDANIEIRDDENKTAIQRASIFKGTFWAMFKAIEAQNQM